MTRIENDREHDERRLPLRGWTLALVAIGAWLLLVTNSAEAQEVQVPEIVLAQVVGHTPERGPAPSAAPADPRVVLVALEMRQ